jgi:signal transduction histidine kinase
VSRADRRLSIRVRLALASAGLGLFVAGLALLVVYAWIDHSIERDVDGLVARELAELTRHHAGVGHEGLEAEIRRRSHHGTVAESLYVFAESRTEIITGNLPRWPDGPEGSDATRDFSWEESSSGFRIVRHARAASVTLSDGRQLLVGRDLTEERGLQQLLAATGVGVLVAAVLVAVLGGLAIAKRLLRRVDAMRETVVRILAGDREERVPVEARRDEFDDLALQFNQLLDENQKLLTQMRGVTDDVAHDLRTPLSRMRGHIEAALAGRVGEDPAREVLHLLLAETDGVLDTFNALLRIAQIESGTLQDQMGPVDLSVTVRDAADLYQPVAEEAGLELESRIEPDVTLRGDRHLLAQAVVNLLDNAIKYSPTPGRVQVAVERTGEGAEVSVTDFGPGIPPEDRERVIQRFVRLDRSRQTPGTGLGLSFVAAVADLHHCELRLDDNAPGLHARLIFPTASHL